jgi:hypothetical protein
MEPGDVAGKARPGRLFVHAKLTDPGRGGPLYCRVRAVEKELIEYEMIHHRDDGSERIGSPWRVPRDYFEGSAFGGWYEGTTPPAVVPQPRQGQSVPLDPRKIGGRATGS